MRVKQDDKGNQKICIHALVHLAGTRIEEHKASGWEGNPVLLHIHIIKITKSKSLLCGRQQAMASLKKFLKWQIGGCQVLKYLDSLFRVKQCPKKAGVYCAHSTLIGTGRILSYALQRTPSDI